MNSISMGSGMNEVMIGELSELADGDYRILRVDDFEFGVFRQGDRVIAYENYCPHDGGPGRRDDPDGTTDNP